MPRVVWLPCGQLSLSSSSVLPSRLELNDANVYDPLLRALLGTADCFSCEIGWQMDKDGGGWGPGAGEDSGSDGDDIQGTVEFSFILCTCKT